MPLLGPISNCNYYCILVTREQYMPYEVPANVPINMSGICKDEIMLQLLIHLYDDIANILVWYFNIPTFTQTSNRSFACGLHNGKLS